jgi:site-specific recombinase XerD
VGQGQQGQPAEARSVLTVFPWSVRVLGQWAGRFRGLFDHAAPSGGALWPSERSPRVSLEKISARFAEYRDALGLPGSVSLHSLRHSYISHLIEDGYDPLFVQQQVGHCYASTTALYTSVSSDFRNRTLRAALDRSIQAALGGADARGTGGR